MNDERAQRLALCTEHDRVRGIQFREVLRLVEPLGPLALARARSVLPDNVRYRDLLTYPIADLLKLMYAVAKELKPDDLEAGLKTCGGATVDGFSKTTAGGLFFNVLAVAGIPSLLRGVPTGYASVVTYGKRTVDVGPGDQAVVHMTGDMLPLAYHVGVFEAVFRAIGYTLQVTATSDSLTEAHYALKWQRA